jgi:hypothetical protein
MDKPKKFNIMSEMIKAGIRPKKSLHKMLASDLRKYRKKRDKANKVASLSWKKNRHD